MFDMEKQTRQSMIRLLVPQFLTGMRIIMGGIALFQAIKGRQHPAALWITYGAITDGLDGIAARRLAAESEFGAKFDLFADYVCYIIAPVVLSLSFFEKAPETMVYIVLGLPLLVGAIRYARNLRLSRNESFEVLGFPGLGTIIYAFLIVTLVFSEAEKELGISSIRWTILILAPIFSGLMVSPIRYPKLMKHRWIFFTVVIVLVIMPFAFTRPLAVITIALGLLYCVVPPILIHGRKSSKTTGDH
jgi:phosphatidylserine synthase